MRPSIRTTPYLFVHGALFLALIATCAGVAAGDAKTDAPAAKSDAPRIRVIERAPRAGDPKHAAAMEDFCDGQRSGDCEVVVQRLGRKPVVGVLFAPDPAGGVRIAGVTPDGAAAGAGIKSGDRLLRIAGKAIAGDTPDARVDNARLQLQSIDAETAVKLTYARDGREYTVGVTPKLDERIMVFAGDGTMMRPGGNVIVRRIGGGDAQSDSVDIETLIEGHGSGAGDARRVHIVSDDANRPRDRRVVRIECKGDDAACRKQAEARIGRPLPALRGADAIGSGGAFRFDCKPGETCVGQQRLVEAFRWNGLNLASVDAQLGRYFGADAGVLVLSTGPALGQLQAGDVIRRIDGKAVGTPRAVMDALRDKPADSTVAVDYLRDRVAATIQLKVPEAMAFPMAPPAPPAPPTPPAPPHPPKAGVAPHAPGAGAGAVVQRKIVLVDKDGQVRTWEDDGDGAPLMAPLPPAPPAPPAPPEPPAPPAAPTPPRVD